MKKRKSDSLHIDQPVGVSPVGDDTRLLAHTAKTLKKKRSLDIGTGTGYIPIFLAKHNLTCDGTDINEFAIQCAQKNAQKNKVTCEFFLSDLFKNVTRKYDLIIFNPPFGNTSNAFMTKILEIVKSLIPKDSDFFIRTSYLLIKNQRRSLIKLFLKQVKQNLKKNGSVLLLLYESELDLIRKKPYKIVGTYKNFKLAHLTV